MTLDQRQSDLSSVTSMYPPTVASPGGIPPWDPPEDDSGEWMAYEGWAEWVTSHGNLCQRVQLLSYRIEVTAKVILTAFGESMKKAAESVTQFTKAMAERPPTC